MILAIIQARTGSKRLPSKVLLPLGNMTVLEQVVNRTKQAKLIDEVMVATSIERRDLPIVRICANNNIRVYCGSEVDVLDRYYQAAKLIGANHILRITADCPLISPEVIDKVIAAHINNDSDYTTNIIKRTYPDGYDVEIMTFATLKDCWEKATAPFDRDGVTEYILARPDKYYSVNLVQDKDESQVRLTLDTQEDYDRLVKLV
jgi:spore coat polysaccharide biosynthesis protein SpsF (cytidylyltransferase family)